MSYHTQLRHALKYAASKHAGQFRKGTDVPYLTHPVEVALYLQALGMNRNVIIAGYLHDTVEDTNATIDDIRMEFGPIVAEIVDDLTSPNKAKALKKAETYGMDSVKVKMADLMCNISDIHDGYKELGDAIFDRFADGKKVLIHYRKLAEVLLQRSQNNMIMKREIPKILTMIDSMS